MNLKDACKLLENGKKITRQAWPFSRFVFRNYDGRLMNVLWNGGSSSYSDGLYTPTSNDLKASDWRESNR